MKQETLWSTLEELSKEPSTLKKEEILRKNDSPELRYLLDVNLNNKRIFHVAKFPDKIYEGYKTINVGSGFTGFKVLCEKLENNEVSGNSAANTIFTFFSKCTKQEIKWFSKCLFKEAIGVGHKIVNKTFGTCLCNFSVMLAPNEQPDINTITYPVVVQPKLDGCVIGETRLQTDKCLLKIKDIVDKKLNVNVLSFNETTKQLEYKPVVNWFNNGKSNSYKDWVVIKYNNSRIRCTKNHKIYTNNGWKCADNLNDKIDKIYSSLGSDYKNHLIFGTLLGDSCISFDKCGNAKSYKLIFNQTNKEYFDFKSSILNLKGSYSEIITGYGSKGYRFVSESLNKFDFPVQLFYHTKRNSKLYGTRKRITEKTFKNYLSLEALSLWIGDDGSIGYNNNNNHNYPILYLHTQGFEEDQVKIFQSGFTKKYKCTPSIYRDKKVINKGFFLRFSTKDTLYLLNLIKNFQCKGVEYKFYIKTEGYINKAIDEYKFYPFKITGASNTTRPSIKYDIEVQDNHNYIANGMVVHNCRAVYIPGLGLIGRNGKKIRNENLRSHFTNLHTVRSFVFDGELYSHKMGFNEIASILNSESKSIPDSIKYYVYDGMTLKEWNQQGCKLGYNARMTEVVKNGQFLNTLKGWTAETPGQVTELFNKCLDDGYEGIMLKDPNGLYQWKRIRLSTQTMMKLKPELSYDLIITGFEEGEGRLKGSLGKINVDFRGVNVGIGSGFTEVERTEIWANRAKYIGSTVEIKAGEQTIDGSLRFPIFKRFRPDK